MMTDNRPSTPPPFEGSGYPSLVPPTPRTPGPSWLINDGNLITGSQHALVPPSPGGVLGAGFGDLASPKASNGELPPSKTKSKNRSPFRFMELPGEIRNIIYHHTYSNPKQALLVHRPRLASLRSSTRMDRTRPLESDIAGQAHDYELSTRNTKITKSKTPSKSKLLPRESNRPFHVLTQISRQIRAEYRPIYLQKQEIGMDLTEIVAYLQTFYSDAPNLVAALGTTGDRKLDMPFTGNLTIAVGDNAKGLELDNLGVDVWPLLDIWANSWKIEAGFGRYMKAGYLPERDGEAKDLYRLFGRRVLRNRSCSIMNNLWRTILRTRSLASVRLLRKPATPVTPTFTPAPTPPVPIIGLRPMIREPRPYIHILFRKECAESWMTALESKAPTMWLSDRGFGGMEHFDVKVGVLVDE
ncbi:hypothetical protein P153DRAFT_409189 [Dothidotthia symphoricarpi CBS 119687]|uniref:F-box domain-containing protein n=1 Tax=Dothidotthia symphoricarpi CBS 119687 TaxID=1392245 RepID=A0A6A6ASH1_9PLEO|nr:uncharacterized protein P153DRAFT_409189 [Dothidotthia symphoricarpi CBS 119687]KAF2133894.1 hypothetical protein P153DRAFT_409189 [Dothidotthia symphoricarpi CBS 119687]